jgi:hypothetical protein
MKSFLLFSLSFNHIFKNLMNYKNLDPKNYFIHTIIIAFMNEQFKIII